MLGRLIRKFLMFYNKPGLIQQLANPTPTMTGRLVKHYLRQRNSFLEKCAVKLCNIQENDKVLELGFGGGVGLRCAYWRVAEGDGMIWGLDKSKYMVDEARKFCALEIARGKVEVLVGDAARMPFPDAFFDKIFHCNCYYFWEDLVSPSRELHRVMKPGGLMVTTLILDSLKELEENKILHPTQVDPLTYMSTLEGVGFQDVGIKYYPYRDKLVYQAITARKLPLETVAALDENKQDQLLEVLESEVKQWDTRQSVILFRRPPPPEPPKSEDK